MPTSWASGPRRPASTWSHYGTEAIAEEIKDTAVAQPLLVAAGLVTAGALFPSQDEATKRIGALAGHSVGEITAAASPAC